MARSSQRRAEVKVETLVRRGAVVAIPALLGAAFLLVRRAPAPAPVVVSNSGAGLLPSAAPVRPLAQGAAAPGASARLETETRGPDVEALAAERRRIALELERGPAAEARVPGPSAGESLGVVPLSKGTIEFEPVDEPAPRTAPIGAEVAPERQCGGLLVRLITATTDASWSFASISPSPGEPAAVHRVGDPVGAFRVAEIEWDRVWLSGASGRCALTMNPGVREGRVAAGRREGDTPLGGDGAPAWSVPADLVERIRRRSVTEYEVDRAAVASIFDRGADLITGVRMEPVKRSDQVVGVVLKQIAQGSLFDRLGVEAGDIVLALNDQPLVTFDAALHALQEARREQRLVARLERAGEAFDLDVRVR